METAIKSIAENPEMATVYASIIKATENVKQKKDSEERVFGVPVLRYARFSEDFVNLVSRMSVVSDPEYPKDDTTKVVAEWEDDGFVCVKKKMICSVACRVKGIVARYEKRTAGWRVVNKEAEDSDGESVVWDEGEWFPKEGFKWETYEDNEKWDVREEDKVDVKRVTMYLPVDDTLRILLNNLWSAFVCSVPEGVNFNKGDWYGMDSMCSPTKCNTCA